MRQYFTLLFACCLCACAGQPHFIERTEKSASHYLPAPQESEMAQLARTRAAGHPHTSGVYPITSAQNALAVRLSAIRAARRSIDVQYFIFRRDETGLLITHELLHAADRGVRVRFLLDDFTTGDAGEVLLMLARHPNIHIRLFNPFPHRGLRALEFFGDFARLHRRMHNKSLTVDNSITFIGGRNLSNRYFGIDKQFTFGDLDLLAIGEVVTPISEQFDTYWNSRFSYPVQAVISKPVGEWKQREFTSLLERNAEQLLNSDYGISLQNSPVIRALQNNDALWHWVRTRALYDPPHKILEAENGGNRFAGAELMAAITGARQQLIIISPYVLPGPEYLSLLTDAAHRGVEVHILTNSLSSTDVVLVHGAYRKYREPLLAAGVHLYELPNNLQFRLDNWEPQSKSLLHAKAFVIDSRWIYVGSFNLDNRSIAINTELGLLIDSPGLAGEVAGNFVENIRATAYLLKLENGGIVWQRANGETHRSDPGASALQKIGSFLSGWLPIEHLL